MVNGSTSCLASLLRTIFDFRKTQQAIIRNQQRYLQLTEPHCSSIGQVKDKKGQRSSNYWPLVEQQRQQDLTWLAAMSSMHSELPVTFARTVSAISCILGQVSSRRSENRSRKWPMHWMSVPGRTRKTSAWSELTNHLVYQGTNLPPSDQLTIN